MSTYRQILLHVGLSKTGTTSIQETCCQQREYLAEMGVCYPRFTAGEHVFLSHSIPLTAAICAAPGRYGLGLRRRFGSDVEWVKAECRRQLDALLQRGGAQTLVLSSEIIESWTDEDLQSLGRHLAPYTEDLRVIAYLRSPESTLESILQERAKAGSMPEPESIVGRVKDKYQRLQRNFHQQLEVVNFHRAVEHPQGLVGTFLSLAGIPGDAIGGLEFSERNRRLSMEGFSLVAAVNRQFPKRDLHGHDLERLPHDLDVLAELPGQPFRIPGFIGSDLHRKVMEETRWFESRLGFEFPVASTPEETAMWQPATVCALEGAVAALDSERIRQYLGRYLLEQGQAIAARGGENGELLLAVAARLGQASGGSPGVE